MIKFVTYIFVLLIISACSTKSKVEESEYNDVNKEVFQSWYSKTTNFVLDTLYINIEKQVSERTTADSTSHLYNKFCTSDARINVDGTLFHNLILLPQTIPKKFKRPETTITDRQTIIKSRTITKTITREITKKIVPLDLKIWAMVGKGAILILFIIVFFRIIRYINHRF